MLLHSALYPALTSTFPFTLSQAWQARKTCKGILQKGATETTTTQAISIKVSRHFHFLRVKAPLPQGKDYQIKVVQYLSNEQDKVFRGCSLRTCS